MAKRARAATPRRDARRAAAAAALRAAIRAVETAPAEEVGDRYDRALARYPRIGLASVHRYWPGGRPIGRPTAGGRLP